MINFIIAFDERNSVLGGYFEDCKNDIARLLDEQRHLVKYCKQAASNQCTAVYIDLTIPQINDNPFVFIAFTHGDDDGLICNKNAFVSTENSHHFRKSLFYSNACLIGGKLAPILIEKGCKAFVGYKEEVKVYYENEVFKRIFMECDNFALKMFLTSDSTIGHAVESMKNHYTKKIDYALELCEDTLFISFLREDRDALVCLGDKELKKEDLFIL
jgi:hypothetical protein